MIMGKEADYLSFDHQYSGLLMSASRDLHSDGLDMLLAKRRMCRQNDREVEETHLPRRRSQASVIGVCSSLVLLAAVPQLRHSSYTN
jgi:hypothetical protein